MTLYYEQLTGCLIFISFNYRELVYIYKKMYFPKSIWTKARGLCIKIYEVLFAEISTTWLLTILRRKDPDLE